MPPVDLSWLVRLRWAAACVLVPLTAVVRRTLGLEPVPPALLAVLAVQLVSNAALARAALRGTPVGARAVTAVMVLDTVVLTGLLAASGGASNPFSVLYLVHVVLAAVLLPPRATWGLLLLALGCFALLFGGLPETMGAGATHARLMALHLRGMWVAFAVAAGTLVACVVRVRRLLAAREAELAVARERAGKQERLASLATLAAGAAHALGTPLATIAVAARELERRLEPLADLSDATEDVRLVREQVERCRAALDGLSHESGASVGEPLHPRPLSQLLEAALDGLPERSRVRVDASGTLADATAALPVRALGQSVQALVRNALQASPPDAPVTLRLDLADARLHIEVEDRGAGMPADVLARAGEPFFSTKPSGQGLGLGLFVARSLAEQLGGTLDVRSAPAAGTRARLTVPLHPSA